MAKKCSFYLNFGLFAPKVLLGKGSRKKSCHSFGFWMSNKFTFLAFKKNVQAVQIEGGKVILTKSKRTAAFSVTLPLGIVLYIGLVVTCLLQKSIFHRSKLRISPLVLLMQDIKVKYHIWICAHGNQLVDSVGVDCFGYRLKVKGGPRSCLPHYRQRLAKVHVSKQS